MSRKKAMRTLAAVIAGEVPYWFAGNAKATGTQDKEIYQIKGASHIRTYWVPEYVDDAVKKLNTFFNKNL